MSSRPLPALLCCCPAQKNLKKNMAKYAKGNGDRTTRNFANAAVRSRQVWLDTGGEGNEYVWAEAFIEMFNHLAFHLQGQYWGCFVCFSFCLELLHGAYPAIR